MAPAPRRFYRRRTVLRNVTLPCLLVAAMHAAAASAAGGAAAVAAAAVATADAADYADVDATAAALSDPADSMAGVGADDLYLDVTVNGRSSGLAHFGLKDGELWASLATLRRLAFIPPPGTPDPVRLRSLKGVQVDYDAAQQSVTITAPLTLLNLANTSLTTRQVTIPRSTASPGVLLNYEVYGTHQDSGPETLSGYTELRAFSSNFVFSSTALLQESNVDSGWNNQSVLLDTTLSESFPERMLTLNVGDTLTAATSWSQSTRIGGLQFGTNFALQPYTVTTPLPQFFGQATLPSQLDLYIDGVKQYTSDVPAGPFQLNTVPGINGAGTAQVVLTDALGRVTNLDFSLYNAQQLLQKGLTDWSVELGAVRENYGLDSFDYGHDPMGSATWRYGLTNGLTLEAHGEATDGLTEGGAGGDWLLGEKAGILSASMAGSAYQGTSGTQFSLGYTYTDGRLSVGLNAQQASSGYHDVASLYGSPPPLLQASANLSYFTRLLGTFGVNYADLRYPQQPSSRYGSLYWLRSFGNHVTASFNYTQDLDSPSDRSIYLSLTIALGERTQMEASVQHQAGANVNTLDATETVPTQGGWGWRLQAQQGDDVNGGLAELDYLGRYGQVQAGYSSLGGSNYAYGGAMGSLVAMDDHLFAARQITNGFAVVSTDGIPNVPVKLQNNPIGTTDSDGLLLVTPLNSYQNNKLSIDPLSLPADVRIGSVDVDASPTDRAGTLVSFGLTPVRAATIILTDADGKPLPLGSTVRVRGHDRDEPALVGYDGMVYLDTLDVHDVLDVGTPAGPCHVSVDYHAQPGSIPQIGPLRCTGGP